MARVFLRRMSGLGKEIQNKASWIEPGNAGSHSVDLPHPNASSFFNRNQEMEWLKQLLKPCPGTVGELVIVTGPRDSGKSALISEFVRRQKRNEYKGVSFKVDLREQACIAKLLRSSIFETFEFEKGGGLTAELKNAFKGVETATDMAPLLWAIKDYGLTWRNRWAKAGLGYEDAYPTLIIDEANLLHQWTLDENANKQLVELMAFIVMLTKQEGLMNAVFLSSENFFPSWIKSFLGSNRCTPVTVGDLPGEEARAFLMTGLGEEDKEKLTDELWEDIFSNIGGRMLPLARVAKHFQAWSRLKRSLLYSARVELQRALDLTSFSPGSGYHRLASPAWSKQDWIEAMEVMVRHEDGIVPFMVMGDKLTARVVWSLIEHGLLDYGEDTGWSRDVTRPSEDFPLVMPVSRVHFRAMQHLLSAEFHQLARR